VFLRENYTCGQRTKGEHAQKREMEGNDKFGVNRVKPKGGTGVDLLAEVVLNLNVQGKVENWGWPI